MFCARPPLRRVNSHHVADHAHRLAQLRNLIRHAAVAINTLLGRLRFTQDHLFVRVRSLYVGGWLRPAASRLEVVDVAKGDERLGLVKVAAVLVARELVRGWRAAGEASENGSDAKDGGAKDECRLGDEHEHGNARLCFC